MPCHGIRTYTILSHGTLVVPEGSEEEDVITLPHNFLVIMNCKSERQWCELEDQAALYKLYSNNVFEVAKSISGQDNGMVLNAYLDTLLQLDGIDQNNYCIFKDKCPNLALDPELKNWRDGIFQLPINCLPYEVYIGLSKHLNTRDFQTCNDTYKQFAVPAMARSRNTMKEHAKRLFKYQTPTLRHALEQFYFQPQSERYLNVVIVHACTNREDVVSDSPQSYEHPEYVSLPFRRRNLKLLKDIFLHAATEVCQRVGGGPMRKTEKRVMVLGKERRLFKSGRTHYIRFQNTYLRLREARKLEAQVDKPKKKIDHKKGTDAPHQRNP